MYTEDELLPISGLQHVLFCERRAALVHVENQWQDNILTAEGTVLHEKAHQADTESRSGLRIARGLWLRSLRLGLYGKADVVEFRKIVGDPEQGAVLSGVSGRWRPYPVEYKRGSLREEISFEIQLCAQGICLEEMLGIEISSGALYYGKTNRRLEVQLNSELRKKTESAAIRLHEIIKSGITPSAPKQPKCNSCSMMSVCLPGISEKRKNVDDYVRRSVTLSVKENETLT
jgi:CRISPR-associated exonuclease Cas4